MTVLIFVLILLILLLSYLVFNVMNKLYDIEDMLLQSDYLKGGFDVFDITT